jgi:ceramide glucosyltransferase
MAELALALVVVIGLAAVGAMVVSQWRQLAVATPPLPVNAPPVSVLKPLKGVDPGLEENLATLFALDYPSYEIILGTRDADDPALAVARRVAAAHPEVPCRVVADAREIGPNPKVSNLANLERLARHELLLISDSNVRVPRGYLADLVAHLARPGVGLVSSPFRGTGFAGAGGALEALQLNTFVNGGVSAAAQLAGAVCVVGKSMLLRRATLERLGGFAYLGRHLAEDQVCGEDVDALGEKVVVSGMLVDNRVGAISVRAFLARHLRWAKIRRRMNPVAYAAELLLDPLFLALVGAAALRSGAAIAVAAFAWLGRTLLDVAAERALGVRRPLALYPLLTLAREVLVGATWAVPWFTASVRWRGNTLRVGPRTLLVPLRVAATPAAESSALEPAADAAA